MADLEQPGPSGLCIKDDVVVDPIINEKENLPKSSEPMVVIKLVNGKPLVWKPEEWLNLQKHRIYGTLIGIPSNFPRQNSVNGLPMQLLKEEVTLILEKNLGIVCNYSKTRKFPSVENKKDYAEYLEKNKQQQSDYLKEVCRKQVEDRIDAIVEGKRRKLMASKKRNNEDVNVEPEIKKEEILEHEIQRRLEAATRSHLVQIPIASPYLTEQDLEPVDWTYPNTPKEKVRYSVYKDMYEKGFSLTGGSKFGGDFLAYPGEPWKFHAFFIVRCLEYREEIKLRELIVLARLGTNTRKNLVLGSVDEYGNVLYNTLSWPGGSR